jgi:transcriptional regulator with XRE-family HTH domain
MFKERKREWVESNPLRKWRLDQGHTQADVGNAIGMNFHSIYNWETGMASPDSRQLLKLSSLMNNKNLAKEWVKWHQDKPRIGDEKDGRQGVARKVSGAGRGSKGV